MITINALTFDHRHYAAQLHNRQDAHAYQDALCANPEIVLVQWLDTARRMTLRRDGGRWSVSVESVTH